MTNVVSYDHRHKRHEVLQDRWNLLKKVIVNCYSDSRVALDDTEYMSRNLILAHDAMDYDLYDRAEQYMDFVIQTIGTLEEGEKFLQKYTL